MDQQNLVNLDPRDALWYQHFDKVFLSSKSVCLLVSLLFLDYHFMAFFFEKNKILNYCGQTLGSVNNLVMCYKTFVESNILYNLWGSLLDIFWQYDWDFHKKLGETSQIKLINKCQSEIVGHQSLFPFLCSYPSPPPNMPSTCNLNKLTFLGEWS